LEYGQYSANPQLKYFLSSKIWTIFGKLNKAFLIQKPLRADCNNWHLTVNYRPSYVVYKNKRITLHYIHFKIYLSKEYVGFKIVEMSLPRLFIVSQTNPLPTPSSPAPPPLCQRIKVFHHIWARYLAYS
jgi:hypothetical protein